ncbi:MAG: class I mannose-6-phosphate isomerase [Chloroflexi bacterium]|nr:class I mannose-6-phosphate isomerase [Chloroflexota bacterium]
MTARALYPLKLRPALRVKVWGGRRLEQLMRKRLPTAEPYGESWELHDSAMVVNGPLQGASLGELARRFGAELLGCAPNPDAGVPLLAKLIDATDWLSIQAHPNDEQAQALEGEARGKTEAWVVLHADEGARLVIGLQPGTTRDQMAEAIGRNQLEALLIFAEVATGDVLQIPANTVHALGPGLLIYEIQQASDTTYRLYDWGRVDLDGQPRELHIEKGLRVANLASLPRIERPDTDLLVESEYFRAWRHELAGGALDIPTYGRFQSLTCIAGEARVSAASGEITLETGESGMVPACIPAFAIGGQGVVLRACQP